MNEGCVRADSQFAGRQVMRLLSSVPEILEGISKRHGDLPGRDSDIRFTRALPATPCPHGRVHPSMQLPHEVFVQ